MIESKGEFVRALKEVVINCRSYYIVILQDAYAPQHLIAEIPETFDSNMGGRRIAGSSRPRVPLVIRGKLGLIPSDNYGLLEPFALPNVAYQCRQGQNNSMIYTVRQTLTNISDHILHQ